MGFINYVHSRAYARLRSRNQVLPDAVDLVLCDTDTEHVQPGSVVERVAGMYRCDDVEQAGLQVFSTREDELVRQIHHRGLRDVPG